MSRHFVENTGIGNIDISVTPLGLGSGCWQFNEFTLHLAATSSAASVITTLNSNAGAAYDTKLDAQLMSARGDYHYQPTYPIKCQLGDSIDLDMTCATRWGLTAVWSDDQ